MLTPMPVAPLPILCPAVRVPDVEWVPVPLKRPVPIPVRVH